MPVDPEHPAMQPDPDKDKYKNGETGDWAEEPHEGPLVGGEHPATPTEIPAHPASKSAAEIREAAERKAAKCIRVAQALLGPQTPADEIENQALPFMHLPDAHLDSTLARMDEFGGRQASAPATSDATNRRLARIEKGLRDLKAMMDQHYSMDPMEEAAMDEEQMLAQMLEEEAMMDEPAAMEDDPEAMLRAMLAAEEEEEEAEEAEEEAEEAEEEAEEAEEEAEEEEEEEEEDDEGMEVEASMDIDMTPAGLDQDVSITENDSLLQSIFTASEDEEMMEEEEEVEEAMEEEEEGKMASRTASAKPRPKPRKPARGARSLGNVAASRTASGEMADLEKLWTSAPDVSDFFSNG